MELLGAFDLDFVMTSEREWGCYPTVPAVAIYQLSSRTGIDAVGLTRWVWNGRERVRADPGAGTNGGDPDPEVDERDLLARGGSGNDESDRDGYGADVKVSASEAEDHTADDKASED